MAMEQQQPAVVDAVGGRGVGTTTTTVPPGLRSRSNRLADQAATAALLVTHPDRRLSVREPAAVAAATEPQDFHESSASTDWRLDLSHASASAALAHVRSKPIQVWSPPPQPAAERAALHARELRAPDAIYVAKATPEGHKAATSALRDRRSTVNSSTLASSEVELEQMAELERKANERREKALMAATGAFNSNRRRAGTAPSSKLSAPVPANRQSLAVSAAGASREAADAEPVQPPSGDFSPTMEASRIQHITNTDRQLYTSHPPVGPNSQEEQRKRNVQQAAVISMARDMYGVTEAKEQQKQQGTAVSAAQQGQTRMQSRKSAYQSDPAALKQAINLQEAAQKRAQEKLALIDDGGAAFREYYGTATQPSRGLGSRRVRTSSETDVEQSKAIRHQMSSLRFKLNAVDEKREQDRSRLMDAARKNVDAAIHDMERRVYYDTGRAPTSLQREWEEEAEQRMKKEQQTTAASREQQQQQQAGRVNVGAEKFVKMTDVEAVARSRVQPTLDEINDNADEYHDQLDTQRAKELEERLDQEQRKRFQAVERQREADLKAEEKRMKGQLKHENKEKAELSRLFKKSKMIVPEKAEKKAETGAATGAEATGAKAETGAVAATGTGATGAGVTGAKAETGAGAGTTGAGATGAKAETGAGAATGGEPTGAKTETETGAGAGAGAATGTESRATGAATQEPALGSSSEEIPEMYPSQAVEGETALMAGEETQATRSESKLKSWIRNRRRSSRQSSILSEEPDEREPTRSASTTEGFRVREDSRGTALSSHPITGNDLNEMQRRRSVASPEGNTAAAAAATAKSPTKEGSGEQKRSFRSGFKKMVSRNDQSHGNQEIKTNGVSSQEGGGVAAAAIGDAGVNRQGSYVPDTHQTSIPGREDLRNSAVEQGLPVPSGIGKQTSNGTRESRFSEDL